MGWGGGEETLARSSKGDMLGEFTGRQLVRDA